MNAARTLMVALACVLPLSAMAQWQWIDKSGRHVFSDQAPPPDIPAKSIVNGPKGRAMPAPEPDAAAGPAAPGAAAAAAPRVAGHDKDLEAKKKLAEAADAEKRKAAEREFAEAKADSCKRARAGQAALDSGVRLAQVNDKGEREFMDDKQRASESSRLQAVVARDCA